MRVPAVALVFASLLGAAQARAGVLDTARLQAALDAMPAQADGTLGACVATPSGAEACVHGDQRFSLQSVMKLPLAVAVMDAVDRKGWRLDRPVTVRPADLSVCFQPMAGLVTPAGYRTTLGDLVRRDIEQSDCAAADILMARLGGPKAVDAVLRAHGLAAIRVDRDERHLQTEIDGLAWQQSFIDPRTLADAVAKVPVDARARAYDAYEHDARDTATPKAMVALLAALDAGHLLSPSSTRFLEDVLGGSVMFPERLKAGLAPGWRIAHKTGTSGSWAGVCATTNDVGILTAPDGGRLYVAVFLAHSHAHQDGRNAAIAAVSRAAVAAWRP